RSSSASTSSWPRGIAPSPCTRSTRPSNAGSGNGWRTFAPRATGPRRAAPWMRCARSPRLVETPWPRSSMRLRLGRPWARSATCFGPPTASTANQRFCDVLTFARFQTQESTESPLRWRERLEEVDDVPALGFGEAIFERRHRRATHALADPEEEATVRVDVSGSKVRHKVRGSRKLRRGRRAVACAVRAMAYLTLGS